jgi:GNAT superfamily N-acetyltransferase
MIASGFSIGLASEKDETQLLSLINLVQPHIPWTKERLRWQYFQPPAGKARLHVIRSGGDIVSLYAAVAQRVGVGANVGIARMVQDVMTHPEHRGRGFLHQLADNCLKALDAASELGYTFPNGLSEKSFRRTGWKELMTIPLMTMMVDSPPAGAMVSIDPIADRFESRIDGIWERSGLTIGVYRDSRYLNWRYCGREMFYKKFVIESGAGILVLKEYAGEHGPVLHVCDLFVSKERRDLLESVLRFCAGVASKIGARRVTAWLAHGHHYREWFLNAGFIDSSRSDRFMFVHPPAGLSIVEDARAWHVTQGDSDVY